MSERGLTVWETDFTVRGSGAFPFDMLRFDECWPVGDGDGNAMMNYAEVELRTVHLRTRSPHPGIRPTRGRWESFGWIVTEPTP